jgi:hypothetical protein
MLFKTLLLHTTKILFFSVLCGILFIATPAFCSDSQNRFSTGTTVAAFAGNIILPGLGHAIIGNNQKANYYLISDMLLGAGALFTGLYSTRSVDESSKYFAFDHAFARLQITDNRYWENMGLFDNEAQYNDYMDRAFRGTSAYTFDSTFYWQWDLLSSRMKYQEMRKQEVNERNNKRIFGNVMWGLIAGMALDRIISTIDLGLSMKKNVKMPVTMHVESSVWFDRQYLGLVVSINRI